MKKLKITFPGTLRRSVTKLARKYNLTLDETVHLALFKLFTGQPPDGIELECFFAYRFILTGETRKRILSPVGVDVNIDIGNVLGTATASITQGAEPADHDPESPDNEDIDIDGTARDPDNEASYFI